MGGRSKIVFPHGYGSVDTLRVSIPKGVRGVEVYGCCYLVFVCFWLWEWGRWIVSTHTGEV